MSDNARLALLLNDADLNYKSNPDDFEDLGGFYPAIAQVKTIVGTSTPQDRISDITKETYKKMPGMSFSIPFGRTTGLGVAAISVISQASEEAIADAIAGNLKGGTTGPKSLGIQGLIFKSVSFLPEEIKEGNRKRAKPTTGLPTSLPTPMA